MVAEFSFSPFYQAYHLYFVGNGTSLVPDPIYLPTLRSPANVASVLMTALLERSLGLAGAGRDRRRSRRTPRSSVGFGDHHRRRSPRCR